MTLLQYLLLLTTTKQQHTHTHMLQNSRPLACNNNNNYTPSTLVEWNYYYYYYYYCCRCYNNYNYSLSMHFISLLLLLFFDTLETRTHGFPLTYLYMSLARWATAWKYFLSFDISWIHVCLLLEVLLGYAISKLVQASPFLSPGLSPQLRVPFSKYQVNYNKLFGWRQHQTDLAWTCWPKRTTQIQPKFKWDHVDPGLGHPMDLGSRKSYDVEQ